MASILNVYARKLYIRYAFEFMLCVSKSRKRTMYVQIGLYYALWTSVQTDNLSYYYRAKLFAMRGESRGVLSKDEVCFRVQIITRQLELESDREVRRG